MLLIKEFLSTYKEWHAFVIGWCETITLYVPPRYHMSLKKDIPIQDEFHYYVAGRAFGVFTWLFIIAGFLAWLL